MSYGLEVYNALGNLRFSTDESWKFMDTKYFPNSTVSSVSNYDAATDLIFVKGANGLDGVVATVSGTTVSFKKDAHIGAGTATNLNVHHLRIQSDRTAGSDTYGIQVIGSDGNVAFDSRKLGDSAFMAPRSIDPAGTLKGSVNVGSRDNYYNIMGTVPYPTSNNGFYCYYEFGVNKVTFNSYRKSGSDIIPEENPFDIIEILDSRPLLLALPPGSDPYVQ